MAADAPESRTPPHAWVEAAQATWTRISPWASWLLFLGGAALDWLWLGRIDLWSNNLFLLGYLAVLGPLIALEHRGTLDPVPLPAWLAERAHYASYAVPFALGGLLSADLVYYWRSATVGPSLLFVVLLAVLMVAVDRAPSPLQRLGARLALLGLATFLFVLFFVPVVTGWMGWPVVWLAALLATLHALGTSWLARDTRWAQRAVLCATLSLGALMLDALGAIPTVPLSVVHKAFAHSVERVEDAEGLRYRLTFEQPPWWRAWEGHDDPFRRHEGDTVHAFTAIFVPAGSSLRVFHRWQHWRDDTGWTDLQTIEVTQRTLVRGTWTRDDGFRTWSAKQNVPAGPIRVLIETEDGRVFGRMNTHVVPATDAPRGWRTREVW